MSDLERVLERLVEDASFGELLRSEPSSALRGYDLSADDLTLLGAYTHADPGSLQQVEERLNKATMTGLIMGVAEAVGHAGRSAESPTLHHGATGATPQEDVATQLQQAQHQLTSMETQAHHLDAAMTPEAAHLTDDDLATQLDQLQDSMHHMVNMTEQVDTPHGLEQGKG